MYKLADTTLEEEKNMKSCNNKKKVSMCASWVVLMVTHRETANCFTKICKVSRK